MLYVQAYHVTAVTARRYGTMVIMYERVGAIPSEGRGGVPQIGIDVYYMPW